VSDDVLQGGEDLFLGVVFAVFGDGRHGYAAGHIVVVPQSGQRLWLYIAHDRCIKFETWQGFHLPLIKMDEMDEKRSRPIVCNQEAAVAVSLLGVCSYFILIRSTLSPMAKRV